MIDMATPVPEDLEAAGALEIEDLGEGPAEYEILFDGSINDLNDRTVHTYREVGSVPGGGDERLMMLRVSVKSPIPRGEDPRL